MGIPYAPRDRDVALRLTIVLLGAWENNRDNLANLCGSVHPSAARANIHLRESLVCDIKAVILIKQQLLEIRKFFFLSYILRPFHNGRVLGLRERTN